MPRCCPSRVKKPVLSEREPRHRGAAFIVALLVVTLLAGLVLIFARGMNSSAGAARADVSQTQARWIARGALEAIRGELAEKIELEEVPRLDVVGVQAEPMGEGLYWVVGRDFTTGEPGVGPEEVAFGLVGEAGKLNVNSLVGEFDDRSKSQWGIGTLNLVFRELPGVSSTAADAFTAQLAETFSAAETARNTPDDVEAAPSAESEDTMIARLTLHTVDQLAWLTDITAEVLDGEDLNRNGVLDPNEDDGAASPPLDNADGRLDFGLREYLTVYSAESVTADNGEPRVNINQSGQGLGPILEAVVSPDRLEELTNTIPPARPFSNLPDFFVRSQITAEEYTQIHDQLTVEPNQFLRVIGMIDVNQVSAAVLDALPGLEPGDGATIVAARPVLAPGEEPGDFAWLADVLSREKIEAVGNAFTHRSLQFSADVVAVSADGKGFCRLRYVLDCEPVVAGDAELPAVVYVQDLTSLGWPLDPAILADLRRGVGVEQVAARYGRTRL
ncbi:MAG: hypothetical protein AAF333_05520 [Planctomycetota bacterium]